MARYATAGDLPSHLGLYMRLAAPAARGRAQLALPAVWSPDVDPEVPFGDVDTQAPAPCDAQFVPRDDPTASATRKAVAARLSGTMLGAVCHALGTDTRCWEITGAAHERQQVAEQLVLYLYDLHREARPALDAETLARDAADARKMRNEFYSAVPQLLLGKPARLDETPRSVLNPNGSVDLWVAVAAYTARRVRDWIATDVWEDAQALWTLDAVRETVNAPHVGAEAEQPARRALWIQSVLIREHASVGVPAAAADVFLKRDALAELSRVWPTATGVRRAARADRLFQPCQERAVALATCIYVCRVFVTLLVGLREALKQRDIVRYYTLLEHGYAWCATRQPSLAALGAKAVDPARAFYRAVHRAEAALLTEMWALSTWLRTNRPAGAAKDVVRAWAKTMEPHMLTALLVMSHDDEDDRLLYRGVGEKAKADVEAVYSSVPRCLRRCSALYPVTAHALTEIARFLRPDQREDALNRISAFLSDPNALLSWACNAHVIDAAPWLALRETRLEGWALPCDVPLRALRDAHTKEDAMRKAWGAGETVHEIEARGGDDPFSGMEFSGTALKGLCAAAAAEGLE